MAVAEKAKVHSVEALRAFRPELVRFSETLLAALTAAEADASRVLQRLKSERLPYWKRQARLRREKVEEVRREISLKAVIREGDGRATADDRKALDKAKRRLDAAERKLADTQRWIRALDKAHMKFMGDVQPLKSTASAELPRAIAELDRLASSLEAYVAVGAKRGKGRGGDGRRGAAPASGGEGAP